MRIHVAKRRGCRAVRHVLFSELSERSENVVSMSNVLRWASPGGHLRTHLRELRVQHRNLSFFCNALLQALSSNARQGMSRPLAAKTLHVILDLAACRGAALDKSAVDMQIVEGPPRMADGVIRSRAVV